MPMPSSVNSILERRRSCKISPDRVFVSSYGSLSSRLNRALKAVCAKLALTPITASALRVAFALSAVCPNMPMRELSRVMGYSTRRLTNWGI